MARAHHLTIHLILLKDKRWSSLIQTLPPSCPLLFWDQDIFTTLKWPLAHITFSDMDLSSSQYYTSGTSPSPSSSMFSQCHFIYDRGGSTCSAPSYAPQTSLMVIQLGNNLVHCDGLLPWANREVLVACPSVFSSSGWCCHPLSSKEWLDALDIPAFVVASLSSSKRHQVIEDTSFVSMKCMITILDAILAPSFGSKGDSTPPSATTNMDSPEPTHLPLRLETISLVQQNIKATKADGAEGPIHLWDDRIPISSHPALSPSQKLHSLASLRTFLLCHWRRLVTKEFISWFKDTHHLQINARAIRSSPTLKRDWVAGRECIWRCTGASWWDWDLGSCPHFWQCPPAYRTQIRDGIDLWVAGPLPRFRQAQKTERNPVIRAAMISKLQKVRDSQYIIPGPVTSLTSYFSVPKGDTDIQMIYDGTLCGLNDQLWAPWFSLPTIEEHLRAVVPGTYMADLDVVEQFLNFILSPKIQPFSGVDLTPLFPPDPASGKQGTLGALLHGVQDFSLPSRTGDALCRRGHPR